MIAGVLVLILGWASLAGATTRFVDNSLGADCTSGNYSIASKNCTGAAGNAYNTLAEGLALTASGDTLWVRSGTTYTATITSSDYTTGGTSWANAPIIGGCPAAVCGSAEYPTINTTAGNLVNLTTATNKYTILTRLIIDGVNQSTADTGAQLVRWTVDHIRLDDVEVKNAKFHAVSCGVDATGSEVINSRVHDNGLYSVGDNLGNALYWSCSFGLIRSNEFYGNDYASVWFNPGSDNLMYQNRSHDQRWWANISGSRNLIYNELVWDLTGNAMQIGYDCTPAGSVPCSYRNKVYNVTIYNQGGIGVELGAFWNTEETEFKNIIMHCTGAGVVPFKIYDSADANNVISYNRLWNCGAIQNSGTGSVLSNNTTGTPSFTNAATDDFTLQSGSDARDAGTDVSASGVTTDYIGTARPQNSVFDLGAYEYIVSAGGGSGGMTQTPAWDTPRRFHLWRR